jgi:hypothetical protein
MMKRAFVLAAATAVLTIAPPATPPKGPESSREVDDRAGSLRPLR